MQEILQSFILLLVIMDPLVSMSVMLSLIKKNDGDKIRKIAFKAVMVAAIVFFIFAIGGDTALKILGVDLDSFKVAGGIVLTLLGIQMVLGISFKKEERQDLSEIAVVIGTPIITGPATIATSIILLKEEGMVSTLIAGTAALIVVLLSLLLVRPITNLLGESGMKVLSTMMGIVTIAWGVQFILSGVLAYLA